MSELSIVTKPRGSKFVRESAFFSCEGLKEISRWVLLGN